MPNAKISITILLIEDDLQLRRIMEKMLRLWFEDAIVLVAEDASRAIATMSTVLVDLVVSDYDLGPGDTGGDVLRWCDAQRPGLRDRFCFFSGSAAPRKIHYHAIDKGQPLPELRAYLTRMVAEASLSVSLHA